MHTGSHKDLIVWQKAMILAELTYFLTKKLPKSESFGLISQMQRAAVSIPSNIAEGWGRNSANELKRFLLIARGSAAELETQLLLAERLHPSLKADDAVNLSIELQRMLLAFSKKQRSA